MFFVVVYLVTCAAHMIYSEEKNDRYERAAAIAVFQGKIRRGIEALKCGASAASKANASSKGASVGHLTIT